MSLDKRSCCNTATFKADSCFDLTDNPESTGVSGEDVLAFVTGTNRPPALGFEDTPELMFTDEERLPTASTCAPSLVLPRNVSGYSEFKKMMSLSILGSHGFGSV